MSIVLEKQQDKQADEILQLIRERKKIFLIHTRQSHDDLQYQQNEMERVKEDIQRKLLQIILRPPAQTQKPEQHGQSELKQVLELLQESVKTPQPPPPKQKFKPIETPLRSAQKQLTTEDEQPIDDGQKKKRVDKNKCRICNESTIPIILGLINQNQDSNLAVEASNEITMRKIREKMHHQRNEQIPDQQQNILDVNKQGVVPYIQLNYSAKLIICKRCRFKFHADCLKADQDKEKQNDNWICQFCESKIKELQSLNQWDYENNKKKKKTDDLQSVNKKNEDSLVVQKLDDHKNMIERIRNKSKIFKIVQKPL